MSHASVPADLAAPLPIARYRFRARVLDPLALPQYAGSLLRGQFGAALRHLACMTRQSTCTGCPLLATCPYTRIFEAPAPEQHQLQRFSAIPNAYVVEPPAPALHQAQPENDRCLQPGQELVFHMVLTGQALEQLPLVIVAWQRALAQGLTRLRSRPACPPRTARRAPRPGTASARRPAAAAAGPRRWPRPQGRRSPR